MIRARYWQKAASIVIFATAALLVASWWIAGHPYHTPGTRQVFRTDSSAGALSELLVLLIVAAVIMLSPAGKRRRTKFCAAVMASYIGAVVVTSLLTPRKIISVGDSYCWDTWCMGIENVSAKPSGSNTLFTVQARIFTDSSHAQVIPVERAKDFFYIRDEQGKRLPLLRDLSFDGAEFALEPGSSAQTSLAFLAPSQESKLYLSGDVAAPPWVRLYLASDLNPFHRPTLLCIK